jgi:hypothetical protein
MEKGSKLIKDNDKLMSMDGLNSSLLSKDECKCKIDSILHLQ